MPDGMLNEKMKKVADAAVGIIISELSVSDQLYLFDGRTTVYDLVKSMLYICSKGAYHYQAEKHSLRYYLDRLEMRDDARDAERMIRQRTLSYIYEQRIAQHELLDKHGFTADGLLPPDMATIDKKLAGYQFDPFQFWEICNVHDMALVREMIDRKFDVKNYPTHKLGKALEQYDEVIREKKAVWESGAENAFTSYMAFHTLESRYSIEFVYRIASAMAQAGIRDLDDMTIRVCSHCEIVSEHSFLDWAPAFYTGQVLTDQAFLVRRLDYIDDIINLQGNELLLASGRAFEARAVVAFMMHGFTYRDVPIQKWFNQNTSHEDWMSVSRYCNDFEAWQQNKDYQDKKIASNFKRILNAVSHDFKNPDIRS